MDGRPSPKNSSAHVAAVDGKDTLKQAPCCPGPRPTSSRQKQERLDDPQSQSFVVAKVESVRRPGPPLDTERQWPRSDDVASRTVISPLACFAALVTSSLTMKPSGTPSAVGISIRAPSTTTRRGASPSNSNPAMSSQSCVRYCVIDVDRPWREVKATERRTAQDF